MLMYTEGVHEYIFKRAAMYYMIKTFPVIDSCHFNMPSFLLIAFLLSSNMQFAAAYLLKNLTLS